MGRTKMFFVSQCSPPPHPPAAVIDTFSVFILVENGRLDSKVTVDYYHYYFYYYYFWLSWVFIVAHWLFLAAVSGGYSLLR